MESAIRDVLGLQILGINFDYHHESLEGTEDPWNWITGTVSDFPIPTEICRLAVMALYFALSSTYTVYLTDAAGTGEFMLQKYT